MKKKFIVDGQLYEIPDAEVGAFLKDNPNAKASYDIDGQKYEIPHKEMDAFEVDMGLKKKEKTLSNNGQPSLEKNLQPTATPEQNAEIPLVSIDENQNDKVIDENDLIAQALKADKLSNAEKNIPMASSGKGGNIQVASPDIEGREVSKKITQSLKDKGYDSKELAEDFKDFPTEAFDYERTSKKNLLELYKENKPKYKSLLNTAKNTYKIGERAGNHLANEYASLYGKTYPNFQSFESALKSQQEIINTALTGEERDVAHKRLAESSARLINSSVPSLMEEYNQSQFKGKITPDQYAGLKTLEIFEPEKYKQTVSFINTPIKDKYTHQMGQEVTKNIQAPVAISTTYEDENPANGRLSQTTIDQKLGLEKRLQELSAIGRQNLHQSITSQNKDLEKQINSLPDGDVGKNQLIEQYNNNVKGLNNVITDAEKDNERYPLSTQLKLDRQIADITSKEPGLLNNAVIKFALQADKPRKAFENIFGDNPELQMQRSGENESLNQYTYLPEEFKRQNSPIIPVYPKELEKQIKGIYANKDLSFEEKQKQAKDLLVANQSKIQTITNPEAGKTKNFFSKATAYTMSSFLGDVGGMGFTMAGNPIKGTSGEMIGLGMITHNDHYTEAVEKGIPNPNEYAALHTGIDMVAAKFGTQFGEIKKLMQTNPELKKALNGVTEDIWNAAVTKDKSIISRISKGIEGSLKSNGKMIAQWGGAVPAAHNIANNTFGNENKSASDIAEESFNNMKDFAIGQLPLMFAGAYTGYKKESALRKSLLWEIGDNMPMELQRVKELEAMGKLTPEKATQRTETIKEVNKLIGQVPTVDKKGNPLTDQAKVDYLYNLYIKNKVKSESGIPEKQKDNADKTAMVADHLNDNIIDPKTDKQLESRVNSIDKELEAKDEEGKLTVKDKDKKELLAEKEAIENVMEERKQPEGQPSTVSEPKVEGSNTLTKDAVDLLDSVKGGSKPAFVTNNLKRIAKENGIEVNDNTKPDDIINALKEKQLQGSNTLSEVKKDENNNPITFYHGTNADFNEFDNSKKGTQTDAGLFGRGFYFANTEDVAKRAIQGGAKVVKKVNLILNNPFEVSKYKSKKEIADYLGMDENQFTEGSKGIIRPTESSIGQFTSAIKEKGYDGVIVDRGGNGISNEYVVFDKSQIKPLQSSKPVEQTTEIKNETTDTKGGNESINAEQPETEVKPEEAVVTESTGATPPKEPIDNTVIQQYADEEMTKMANAINDAHIEGKFGVDALNKMAEKLQDTNVKDLYNRVKDRIQKGTLKVKDIRDRVLTTKSGNEADQVALLYDLAELKGKERNLQKEIIENDNPDEIKRLQNELISVQNDMLDNALANKYIGRQASSIFRARQLWVNKEATLFDMTEQYKASKGIKELTNEQEAHIRDKFNIMQEAKIKLESAKAELEKAVKENQQLKEENEALKKLKDKAGNQKKNDRKLKSEEAINKSNERIKKSKETLKSLIDETKNVGIAPKVNPFLAPKMVAEISKIAAEKVYQGVVKFDELVKNVLDEVRDVLPDWKEEDVIKHLLTETDAKGNVKPSKSAFSYIASKERLADASENNLKIKIRNYEKAQKEVAIQNFRWQQDRRMDLMKNKPVKERIIDSILRWQRFAVLSYPTTLVKLATVVAHQLTLKPLKWATQWGVSKLLPSVAKKSPIWGTPTISSLAKYYSSFIRNFSIANLKEHFTGIDTKEILYGKPFMYDEWAAGSGFLEMPGRSHGYIKSFIKNPEFQFAHEQQIQFHLDKMEDIQKKLDNKDLKESEREALEKEYEKYDITNEDVLERVNKLSLEHGKWSILMNDSKFVEKFQKWTKDSGVAGALVKSEIPIVKIPVNYIGRYFALKYGLIRAIIGKPKWESKQSSFPGVAEVLIKGTEKLTNDQAELLSKSLTVGTFGASLFLTGYLLRNQVKKNDDGSAEVGGVHISKNLTHSPELETLFSGADMGKKKKGNLQWAQDFVENDIEVVSKNPFLQTLQYGFLANTSESMLSLVKGKQAGNVDKFTHSMTDAVARKVGDMTVPGFIKQPAQWMDTKEKGIHPMGEPIKRKPNAENIMQRFWQNIEMNIPGLRSNVPMATNNSGESSSGKPHKPQKTSKTQKHFKGQ